MKVVIIGGVAGGATAAARLRRLTEEAEIIMLERGEYISFANCGLPYYIGGEITQRENLTLQTPQSFRNRFGVDVRNRSEAIAIDPAAKTVQVQNSKTGERYLESYDKLILSMGAEPVMPPILGLDSEGVFTLRNIPDMDQIKGFLEDHQVKSAIVAGGGFIGLEMAENLARAGLAVTIVELADHVMAPLDFDMAAELQHYITDQGIRLILKNGVTAIRPEGKGLAVSLHEGTISTDMLVMAVGVKPESALAKAAGLALNSRGAIIVDEEMQTSVPDIYAVGDVVEITDFVTKTKGYQPLAGPANKQGRIAANNLCGLRRQYRGTQGSAILKFFDLTVATTGINESIAKANALNYDKVYTYSPSHAGYYPGGKNMSIKTLYEKDSGKILGAQIIGYDGVDKRCDVLATAIRAGFTAYDLAELELCYAPPFSSAKDPVNMIGFVIENVLSGKVKNFHWHDVATLPRDGSVTLLDVRTKGEVERGKIEGFYNIPLDELRQHLAEISQDKPVYVHCHSGLRSYFACRLLAGAGYDCYNLSGGYRFYDLAVRRQQTADFCCYK